MRGAFTSTVLTLLLSGCAVGPNYTRPSVPAPPQFRNAPDQTRQATPESLADRKWPELFHDEALTQLVDSALRGNYDLRIAAERVLEARAQLGIQRAPLFPNLDATGSFTSSRTSTVGSIVFIPKGIDTAVSYTQTGFALSWELDLWGRIRRLNEAARAQYLASEDARRGVVTTLIADVITAYFGLRELDLELEIAEKTREAARQSLKLIQLRHNRGVATGLDVKQAEQFLYTATAQIAATERAVAQQEDALSVLLGGIPSDVPRGRKLEEIAAPDAVPAGLPSALLERRPDIRQAEMTLIAANAAIGAARAQYFPQISLTGFLGAQSRALSELFTGPGRQWNFAPASTLPIFNAGRIRSNVKLTEALRREAEANYQKAIRNAFREVSDALIAHTKTGEQMAQQELLVRALRETSRLSRLRYQGGLDSYLQVLDADRNLFQGELLLAQLRRNQLLTVVDLYRALGGGWQ
jgi:multidrug efflux system outer membrane protein